MPSDNFTWERKGETQILWLGRGKGNALDANFLGELEQALEESARAAPRGLILSASGSIFCAGLDLVALPKLGRAGMEAVLAGLYALSRALFTYPRPVVVAINGHAIAGGAYLALCGDIRLMARGDARIGLNESALGLSMPAHTLAVLRYALPNSIVSQLLFTGELYSAAAALELGLVDELVESPQLIDRACERILAWTASVDAFADIKRRLKAPALQAMDDARSADAAWLDLWFSNSTQERLRVTRERLLGGKRT